MAEDRRDSGDERDVRQEIRLLKVRVRDDLIRKLTDKVVGLTADAPRLTILKQRTTRSASQWTRTAG
jgi:hypothetical protein